MENSINIKLPESFTPYFVIGIICILILALLIWKILPLIRRGIHVEKRTSIDVPHKSISESSKRRISIEKVKIIDSETSDIKGNVSIKDVSVENSVIGRIEGQ